MPPVLDLDLPVLKTILSVYIYTCFSSSVAFLKLIDGYFPHRGRTNAERNSTFKNIPVYAAY